MAYYVEYDPNNPLTASQIAELEAVHGKLSRFSRGKNAGLPKTVTLDTEEQMLKWGERLYKFEGLVRIQDLPAVLQEKYAERGEFRGAQTLADGTPVFSTGTDAMKELANYFMGIEDNE